MKLALEGQTALVTGGAVRLGRGMSLELARLGSDIIIHYHDSKAAAQSLAEEIQLMGRQAWLMPADLRDPVAAARLVDEACDHCGKLDILVNSAAIFPDDDSLEARATDQWEPIMNLNLRAPLILSREFARQVAGDSGQIVNILDARTGNADSDHLVYRLAKSGLAQLTKMLAKELAPDIRVNGLALGAILPPQDAADDHMTRLSRTIPLGRTGEPGDVAQAIAWLVQQDFVTGAIIPIDGGEFL